MQANQYQRLAERTECNQTVSRNRMKALVKGLPVPVRLNHAVLGLCGEVGELAAAIERWIYYGQPLDETNLQEELGDCLWYMAEACNAAGFSLEAIMEANIQKLQKRYPEKFSESQAVEENRDREKEAEIIKKTATKTPEEPEERAEEKAIQVEAHEAYHSVVCGSCCEGASFGSQEDTNSYSRKCSRCKRTPIHDNNSSGLCPDCYAEENPQE